ncbi:hypothetical protein C1I95_28770 [Micromonospora craterilacus]|uniref:Uncharacterized protein n=1 Tax=Micromonospora craterilacus TaxID=1655439 RepID=A0A2W2DCD6_9ACTN|nr:hypothetical protein [Micromonospora craterilacus]PZG09666.1 hypothetical protein C1I95_28770 [Micromonospora craterilacus]
MLSFDAVHALAGSLVAAETDAHTAGWRQPATVLLIHSQPLLDAALQQRPAPRSLHFPLRRDEPRANMAGLPTLLSSLAVGIGSPDTPYRATLNAIGQQIRRTEPDARLMAWAACYEDIHTISGHSQRVRCVDAADVDGRAYRITRLHGEDHPQTLVDDHPDPDHTPATYPGLVALVTATASFITTPARTDVDVSG